MTSISGGRGHHDASQPVIEEGPRALDPRQAKLETRWSSLRAQYEKFVAEAEQDRYEAEAERATRHALFGLQSQRFDLALEVRDAAHTHGTTDASDPRVEQAERTMARVRDFLVRGPLLV